MERSTRAAAAGTLLTVIAATGCGQNAVETAHAAIDAAAVRLDEIQGIWNDEIAKQREAYLAAPDCNEVWQIPRWEPEKYYVDMSEAERVVTSRRSELAYELISTRGDCNLAYSRLRLAWSQYAANGRAESYDTLRAQMDRVRDAVNRAAEETVERMVEEADNELDLWDQLATFAGRPNTRGRWAEATDPEAHAEVREARTADLQAALDEHTAEVERIRTIGTQYATEVTEAWAALQ